MAELEADNALRAEPRAIAKALATLTAVCVRPADFDDAKVILWSDRLREVLNEFPGEIALAVLIDWPKAEGGKFWPTENELRAKLDAAMALRRWLRFDLSQALEEAEREEAAAGRVEPDDGLSQEPSGDVAAFFEAWKQRDEKRATSYRRVCRFGENLIATNVTIAEDTIRRELREHAPHVRVIGAMSIDPASGKTVWAL